MAVAGVLILVPLVGLRRIVGRSLGTRLDHCAAIQMQGDVAAQLDGARHPRTGRKLDRAAACCGHSFNGLIDGLAILRLAIALRAERRDIGRGCVESQSARRQYHA